MPTQIIDNFDLRTAKAIDNRFVVGPQQFYTHRDLIDWKYEGMRVWDLNDGPIGTPYVWTGTTYSSENLVSIGGSGTTNSVAKFIATTTVGDSIMYDTGVNVGIDTTTPAYKLDVAGTIRATGNLIGNGQFVTSINADNITSGTLTLNILQNSPTANWILTAGVGGSGQSTWVNPNSITVGNATNATLATTATNANNVNISSTSLNSSFNLLFSSGIGNTTVFTNTATTVKINPSNGNVGIGSSNYFGKLTVCQDSSFGNLPALTLSHNASTVSTRQNFKFLTFVNNSSLILQRYTGASFNIINNSRWTTYGYPYDYEELVFAGRTYINTTNNKTLTFGSSGGSDQIRFYFTGGVDTLPAGGYGVEITNKLKVNGGIVNATTIGFSVANATGQTFTHNLGYIPIAVVVCQDGNVNPNITLLNTTQIRIYNFNSGGNTATGTIYLW